MATQYILNLQDSKRLQGIGSKAEKLHFLIRKGFQVPTTYVCIWDAYLRYLKDDLEIIEAVKAELSRKLDGNRSYAVRSSANVEDNLDYSFAGQFKSVTDVRGVDSILQAIWSVWATTQSAGVKTYLQTRAIEPSSLKMGVVIQEMVSPIVSGVSFSKNPVTGLDEIVVEAVRGSGKALVQEGITPYRWINKWGDWLLKPEAQDIELDLVQEVVRQTRTIAKAYGQAVDLEWVYDGRRVFWVQLRDITTIQGVKLYSNHISKEVLPGMIKPLIWSINIPLVGGVWKAILTELIGQNDLDPNQLVRSFYYRAYFNMGTLGQVFESLGLPRETLEMMMGVGAKSAERPTFKPSFKTLRYAPRLLRFGLDKLTCDRRFEAFLPTMRENYKAFGSEAARQLSEPKIMAEIDKLFALTQDTAYYNVIGPLLMFSYDGMLKSQLRKVGIDLVSFDLTCGMNELHEYDPNVHLKRLNQRYNELAPDLKDKIRQCSYDEFGQLKGVEEFQKGVAQFIKQFGHLSDSGNDFSSVPWREKPDMVLRMIVSNTPSETKSAHMSCFTDLELSPIRRLMLGPVYRKARRFRLYRERISSLYTFGYGVFRPYFLALGEHFVRRGVLSCREDIFYLYFDEVRAIVDKNQTGNEHADKIALRKCEMEAFRDIVVPETIYGDQAPPVDMRKSDKLTGIPTSRGYHTGPAKVVKGIQGFDKVQEGDVLVIPYSDVGWTPLFTKAGGVIAESGGILSHSSIVAREYGIPAVVSVSGACQLEDHTRVTVDGYKGEIIIHERPSRCVSSDTAIGEAASLENRFER